MILTKEQKLALTRVVAYMDEMYAIASPYYGCTEDANILRAMIDSSGAVEPVGGFDLERARGLRDFLQDDCAEVGDVWAEMIAEIERLRGEMENYGDDYVCQMKSKDARIQELEDALVEGLTNFLHYRASCYDPARRCPYAKECDDCSTWDACGHVEKFRSEARQLLQAEGKIGPDADAKPHCWQITEERRDAIMKMSSIRTIIFCPDCGASMEFIDIVEPMAVLRGMLAEVTR